MRLPLLLVPLIAVLTVNALYFPDELQGHDSAHEKLQRKKIILLDTKGSKKPKLLKKAPLMIMKQGIQELNLKDEAEGQSERELQNSNSKEDEYARSYPTYNCTKKQTKVYLPLGDVAILTSKNYPNVYPKNTKCKWRFTTDKDVNLWTFCGEDFNLEPKNKKGKCLDYLKLNKDKFCGTDNPTFISTFEKMSVKFKANKRNSNYTGFYCEVYAFNAFYTSTTTSVTSKLGSIPEPPKPGSTPEPLKPGSTPEPPKPGSNLVPGSLSPAPGPRSGSSECDYSSFGSSHTMNLAPNRQCGARIHRRGVSDSEIQTILQKHNELRAKVANGDETRGHPGPQPGATNMLEMKWNPQLAEVAQAWAEQCPRGHDANRNRKICGKDYSVGQNIKIYWRYNNPASFWKYAIGSLYDEVEDMPNYFVDSYRSPPSGKKIGHYTQVVWADSYEVGCGAIYHEDTYMGVKYPEAKTYVCNYGPAGNVKYQKVYKRGNRAASNCPNGKSSKYNGLCAPPA